MFCNFISILYIFKNIYKELFKIHNQNYFKPFVVLGMIILGAFTS